MTGLLEPPRATVDPSDPYQREAQTFPWLDDDMIARVAAYGEEAVLLAGTVIYHRS